MKKNRDSDALAARLTAAANKPPVVVPLRATAPPELAPQQPTAPETTAPPVVAADQPKQRTGRKPRPRRRLEEQPEDDTVPMSLRPRRVLLNRYVIAASDRTRETGRVVSAQEIMLEVLEHAL